MFHHVFYATVLQFVIYFPHFVFWRCSRFKLFRVYVIRDTLCSFFFCLCEKAHAADLSLVKPLLSKMKVWSVPKWLTGYTNGWGFAIFLSGWYTNGHININLIFSPFRYFQTGFIISGTFLIFTRQERGKKQTAAWDRKRWKVLQRHSSFPGNGQ